MRNPIRITVALDEESYRILEKLKRESGLSQSEIMRNALKFYDQYKDLQKYKLERIKTYAEMLAEGEHVILDINHWIAFLRFIESHPEKEKFWEIHKKIANMHAEEFSGMRVDDILERLEACNFFRINERRGEYTLVLNNEATGKFVRIFLEEVLPAFGLEVDVKEDFMKIRLRTSNSD
ncbi:hypothetical protein Asulf_02073 [Archaeoglobus sulfaticallidus PM70-1]|uniref:Ribbon-helix-helix protein CopG domain-containing protein n=1 Tax=Archaeoglobus sulfaticallidus PM70-1 TaxID=387631 RepID=N0BGC6_9EURY|nr:ribbon-helix-helix protein, CopG family [Archaeoglobus sulfaticallidus]AGK62033.1 hypothetical protein Asulf_02073 [Archaeoglobus sulfaticallidus PM70-1]